MYIVILIDRFFVVVKLMEKIMIERKVFFSIVGVWMLLVVIIIGFMVGWG